MKRLALTTLIAAGLAIIAAVPASAQQQRPPRTASRPQAARPQAARPQAARPQGPVAPKPAGVNIALLDVSYVFKNYTRFNERLESIKGEIKAFETKMREQQKQFSTIGEQLKQYSPDSPEYKRIEAGALRQQVDIQTKAQLKKRDILEKEARSYYDAYQEIQTAVQSVSARYSIGLVLRFDREEMTPTNRASVLKGVNRAVVYQRDLDITDMVLDMLNR